MRLHDNNQQRNAVPRDALQQQGTQRNAVNRIFAGVSVVRPEQTVAKAAQSVRTPVDIQIDEIQAREVNDYLITGIEELAGSIERTGLWQPVIVRKNTGEGKPYILTAGERRVNAMRFLMEKYRSAGDAFHEKQFSVIPAFILEEKDLAKEEDIYRDTNDYSRQLTNFERIMRNDPDMIDMTKPEWQEKYLMLCHPENLELWRSGKFVCKGSVQEKSEYLTAMILQREPDLDISESTVRNYLNLLDRCSTDLRLAVLRGKIPLRVARESLSWLKPEEQLAAVEAAGTDEFATYMEKGKKNAGKTAPSDKRKAPQLSYHQTMQQAGKALLKFGKSLSKEFESLDSRPEAETLSEGDKAYRDQLKVVMGEIKKLEEIGKPSKTKSTE